MAISAGVRGHAYVADVMERAAGNRRRAPFCLPVPLRTLPVDPWHQGQYREAGHGARTVAWPAGPARSEGHSCREAATAVG